MINRRRDCTDDNGMSVIIILQISVASTGIILKNIQQNALIIWGDNTSELISQTGNAGHIYTLTGNYQCKIYYINYLNNIVGDDTVKDLVTGVVFSKRIADLYEKSFYNCPNLTGEIDLSNTQLVEISAYCFSNTAITSVKLPATIRDLSGTVLGLSGCFYNCLNLTSITGLENVRTMAYDCFRNTTSLAQNIVFGANLTSMQNRVFYNSAITGVDFSACVNLVTMLGECFYNCPNLTGEIDLSNTQLVEISAFCFSVTAITSVKLPETVTQIGGEYYQGAFFNCPNLIKVEFMSTDLAANPITIRYIQSPSFYNSPVNKLILHSLTIQTDLIDRFINNTSRIIYVPDEAVPEWTDYVTETYGTTKGTVAALSTLS
jgi:hypothetical protein